MLSMCTGVASQLKLIWAATWMEHIGVYHEFRGTQVVIDLFEFLGQNFTEFITIDEEESEDEEDFYDSDDQ